MRRWTMICGVRGGEPHACERKYHARPEEQSRQKVPLLLPTDMLPCESAGGLVHTPSGHRSGCLTPGLLFGSRGSGLAAQLSRERADLYFTGRKPRSTAARLSEAAAAFPRHPARPSALPF